MLRIKIELDSYGLGTITKTWNMDIWNDLTGTRSLGNYKFKIYKRNSKEKVIKGGEIKNFQRLRWSPWYLLYLCLKEIYGE